MIHTEQSEQNLYKSIHDIISDLLPAKNLYIAIYDSTKKLVSFPYFVDEIDTPPPPEELGNGLTSLVVRSQKPLLANEQMIQKLEEEKKIDLIGPQSFVWLGVPFSIGDNLKGVIAVQSYDEGVSYSTEDEKTLSYFAEKLSITLEKKRTDDKIAQLSQAVEESPVSVVITDPNGFIEYVNLTFTEVTGYSLDEVIGRKPSILKSEFQNDQVYKELWETITAGGNWSGELLNKKKNGELFWELVSISSIKNLRGEITHYVGVKDDITKAKKYEEELLIAKEKAEEMNRLKSNFLSNMSHELRTPLIGILGYAEILSEEVIHDSQKNMILRILDGGKRLSTTLNMILDLARVESNKMEIMINDFHVNDILKTEVYLFYAPAKLKNLKLDLVISNNDCYIAVDEKIFSSIISNLINNAIKYTHEGGITVQVDKIIYESKKYCEIKIIDTGIGIPQDSLSVIFDEFRQVSEGYSRHFEGTGLGLTITKRFVELLNGKIFVESEVGKGTTMSVIFPIVDKPAKLKKK
ncbi:MAG: hypothetical protein C0442_09655 [Chlorobiaceae bacterium]|nr:hypothetical protein [Chlorobiaceae bacterium]